MSSTAHKTVSARLVQRVTAAGQLDVVLAAWIYHTHSENNMIFSIYTSGQGVDTIILYVEYMDVCRSDHTISQNLIQKLTQHYLITSRIQMYTRAKPSYPMDSR